MKTNSFENGQVSLYDLLMSFLLFLIAFALLNGIWSQNFNGALANISLSEIESKSLQVTNALIKTQGYPENWDSSNVEVIGLAERKNAISEEKLSKFVALDYGLAKEKFRLGGYDFKFEFDAVGTADDVNHGIEPDLNQNVVSVKRLVEFNGGEAIVYFKVFR